MARLFRASVKSQVQVVVGVGSSQVITLAASCFLFSALLPHGFEPESEESDSSLPPLFPDSSA